MELNNFEVLKNFVEADVIVAAIGFEPGLLLNKLSVIGVNDKELRDVMGPNQICHGGTTIAGFPNLFLAHGPNSNVVVNGSNTHIMEIQANHVLKLIEICNSAKHNKVEVKKAAMKNWHDSVTSRNRKRAWGLNTNIIDKKSWYINELGHNTENWPDTSSDLMDELNISRQNDFLTQ
jgi:cation diffusion facilitator CzcD-associated flavoprotein CzcO